ncbi:MAG TPA: cache domain-containing protein [Thermoanaerobaculia bacterium]|nr:cache domain-containing protein [Thermoanaerobaculia bacterium]
MRKTRGRTTWRTKLLLLLLAVSVPPLVVLTVWDYAALREAFHAATLKSLQGLARAKAEALEQLTQDRRTQVERIAGLLTPQLAAVAQEEAARNRRIVIGGGEAALPALEDAEGRDADGRAAADEPPAAAPDPLRSSPSEAMQDLTRVLALILWDQQQFEELLVIDPEGRVLASTYEGHEGRTARDLGYFQQGLKTTHFAPLFVSPITNRLTTVVSAPIRGPAGNTLGVLAARLNLSRFFRVVEDFTGLGKTGETVVAHRAGEELIVMAPSRHDPEAALSRKMPLDAAAGRPLREATRGQAGSGQLVDYRDRQVLAAWEGIPSLGWGLVVKIDRSEAMRPAILAGLRMLALTVPLLLVVVAASFIASRELVRPLHQLKVATEKISRGNFDVEIDIRSNDEIGELAASFDRMVAAIKFFRAHQRRPEEEEEFDEDTV